MRVILTGASSFTGYWISNLLIAAGAEVIAPLNGPFVSGSRLRDTRVRQLQKFSKVIPNCPFGTEKFCQLLMETKYIDLFAMHGAHTTGYGTNLFDTAKALQENTNNLPKVLAELKRAGCQNIILTGTVFEQNEGDYPNTSPAVTEYGLSKTLTTNWWQFYANQFEIILNRFVIPNPFGPYEEPRFTSYLAKSWMNGETPSVRTPKYIRDNVPVDLLAAHYASFAKEVLKNKMTAGLTTRPSFYAGEQGKFAQMFAERMRIQLDCPCELELLAQTEFHEPLQRTNSNYIEPKTLKWNENSFWNQLGEYYLANLN